jgi:hypothetical protein
MVRAWRLMLDVQRFAAHGASLSSKRKINPCGSGFQPRSFCGPAKAGLPQKKRLTDLEAFGALRQFYARHARIQSKSFAKIRAVNFAIL